MGISLDLETSIALACAASLSLIFCLVAYALSEGASGRRFKRRIAAIRDRAKGVVSAQAVAARSLTRQQSAMPKIARLAPRWMPPPPMLVPPLAPTARRTT